VHRTPLWRVQPKSSAYDRAATSAGPGAANGYRLPARKQGVFDQRYCDANRIVGDAARGARYAALKRVVRTCEVVQCLPLRPRRLGGAPHCDASLPLLRAAPACMLAVAKLLAVQHMPQPAQACPEPGSVHAEQAGRAGCRMPLPCTLARLRSGAGAKPSRPRAWHALAGPQKTGWVPGELRHPQPRSEV